VACSGDITCFGENGEAYLDRLSALGRPIHFVRGNHETAGTLGRLSSAFPFLRDVSRRVETVRTVQIVGLAGEPDVDPYGPYRRTLADEIVGSLPPIDRSRPLLLVSHYPPAGTRCDGLERRPGEDQPIDLPAGDGGGSWLVRRIAEALRPDLLVCGHYHAFFGTEARLGPTWIVNPGPRGRIIDVQAVGTP
jgi:Icc-related predicted phosphoesterase